MRGSRLNLKQLDLKDRIFGRLTVLGLSEISRNGHSRWDTICVCGTRKTVLGTHLVSDKIKSCGCLMRETGPRNFKGVGLLPLSYFSSVKRGAEGGKGRKPIPFDITIEEMWYKFEEQKGKCKLSNLPINFRSKTASLDRIDSSVGYTYQNIQWLHKDVNMMKRHYNQDYFIELCNNISRKYRDQFL